MLQSTSETQRASWSAELNRFGRAALKVRKVTVIHAISVRMFNTRQNCVKCAGSRLALSSSGTNQMTSSTTNAERAASTAAHQSLNRRTDIILHTMHDMPDVLTHPVLPVKPCHGPITPLLAEANSGQGKPTAY